MKAGRMFLLVMALALCTTLGFAQTTQGGTTDQNSTSTTTSKRHKKSSKDTGDSSTSSSSSSSSTPSAMAGPSGSAATSSEAAGGGNGKVWVNKETKVYHREGDRWYGKTKNGEYMTEAEAQKEGYRPAKEGAAKSKSDKK